MSHGRRSDRESEDYLMSTQSFTRHSSRGFENFLNIDFVMQEYSNILQLLLFSFLVPTPRRVRQVWETPKYAKKMSWKIELKSIGLYALLSAVSPLRLFLCCPTYFLLWFLVLFLGLNRMYRTTMSYRSYHHISPNFSTSCESSITFSKIPAATLRCYLSLNSMWYILQAQRIECLKKIL